WGPPPRGWAGGGRARPGGGLMRAGLFSSGAPCAPPHRLSSHLSSLAPPWRPVLAPPGGGGPPGGLTRGPAGAAVVLLSVIGFVLALLALS
ncbi:hypothetical protein DI494_08685, partial [Stenotrophomonas maltophilia]